MRYLAALSPPPIGSASAPAPAQSAAKSAALVTVGIVLSRLAGLIRQVVTAHFFGTTGFADVLRVSFQVGNITQNLLGEGTLSASFIPVYAKLRGQKRDREAVHFALSALGILLLMTAVASTLGSLLAPQLTTLIAGGFDPDKVEATARVVRIVFPMTGLLALSAWGLGVLNAHGQFLLPYTAPVVWSLAQIAAMAVVGGLMHYEGEPLAIAVAWGALAGAALQLCVLLPSARRLLGGLGPRLDTKDPGVREAARRLPAALLGRGVIQLSGLVDAYLVSFVGSGANAIFGYTQTLYLLPMALLGTGEAAASLPAMARETAGDPEELRRRVRDRLGASLARVAVLTLPTMAGFALLGRELITVLFQGGRFDRESTDRVVPVLATYGLALLANAMGRVLTTTCYALGDTRRPAQYAVYRVIVSTVVAVALLRPLGLIGVVIGAVAAAWIELFALGLHLRRELGGLGLEQVRFGRVLALSVASVGAGVLVSWALPAALMEQRLGSALALVAAGAAFAVVAPALGLFDVRSLLRRRAR